MRDLRALTYLALAHFRPERLIGEDAAHQSPY
jgi:hypothetical protein